MRDKLVNKYLYGLVVLFVFSFLFCKISIVSAEYNDVQFRNDTTIHLTDSLGTEPLIVTSTSAVGSFAVDTSTITVALGGSGTSTLTLQSATTQRYLSDSLGLGTFSCGTSTSSLYFSTATAQTTAVSMGDRCLIGGSTDVTVANQITFNWTGHSTSYHVTNTTLGTSVDTSSSSYTATNLTCNTTYHFTVRGSTSGLYSNTVSFSATTSACPTGGEGGGGGGGSGGGVSSGAPILGSPAMTVVEGPLVTSRNITLRLSVQNVNQMALSEDSKFIGASWVPFMTTTTFALSAGSATKTIYAIFRSAGAFVSSPVSTTVRLNDVTDHPEIIAAQPGQQEPVGASLLAEIDFHSWLKFFALPKSGTITQGKNLLFSYRYTNKDTKRQNIKVARQLVDVHNKVVRKGAASASLKIGKQFNRQVRESTAKLAPGLYFEKIIVTDSKTKQVRTINGFYFQVQKPPAKPAKKK